MTSPIVLPTSHRISGSSLPGFSILLLLALIPLLSTATGTAYYSTLFERIMIFGVAAIGLNLILGLGGLVSLGHGLYVGFGAYVVGILTRYGFLDVSIHLAATILLVGLLSGGIGWVSLRTRGFGFIMITMAFGQMFYYLAVSLKIYGGDEGLVIPSRSLVAGTPILEYSASFYYFVFAILALVAGVSHTLANSPFGLVLSGARQNEPRAEDFGLFAASLSAYSLRDFGCHHWRCRMSASESNSLCFARIYELDAIRHTHRYHRAWWDFDDNRALGGRHRNAHARRVPNVLDGSLDDYRGTGRRRQRVARQQRTLWRLLEQTCC